jgi:hypothetical protein
MGSRVTGVSSSGKLDRNATRGQVTFDGNELLAG